MQILTHRSLTRHGADSRVFAPSIAASRSRFPWRLAWPYATRHFQFRWNRWSDRGNRPDEQATNEFYRRMWRAAAEELSAEFVELPYGFFEVRLATCVTRMHQSLVMLDHPVSLRLATRKPLVHRLLAELSLPVPPHRAYHLADIERARAFLHAAPGPCVVKPARDSGAGDGVTANVETDRDLTRASIYASFFQPELLIERQIAGASYRLLYLDGELIDAIRRRPPMLTGDGQSSVRELITAENRRRAALRGSAAVRRLRADLDCRATLRRAGVSLSDVPEAGMPVQIKTVVNDNAALENESVRSLIGPALEEEGARAANALPLRLAGVDVITPDPTVSLAESGGVINEVNATPGLHHHYNVHNPKETSSVATAVLRCLLHTAADA